MDQASEIAGNWPAIILLSLWWGVISVLDLLARQHDIGKPARPAPEPPGSGVPEVADDSRWAALRALDPGFDAGNFLAGAQRAYEAILLAYAQGNVEALRPLLSAAVLQAFAEACAARRERGETLELTFIGMRSAEIVATEASSGTMEITVRFRAEIVSVERTAAGGVLSGDPAAVVATADLWTFARPVSADRSAWILIATDSEARPA